MQPKAIACTTNVKADKDYCLAELAAAQKDELRQRADLLSGLQSHLPQEQKAAKVRAADCTSSHAVSCWQASDRVQHVCRM